MLLFSIVVCLLLQSSSAREPFTPRSFAQAPAYNWLRDWFGISMPMAPYGMAPYGVPEGDYINVYLLTKITKEEENAYIEVLSKSYDPMFDGSWLLPRLIHRTSTEDGTVENGDMLRLFKKQSARLEQNMYPFIFFADRKSIQDGAVIVAGRDMETLSRSKKTAEEMTKLASKNGIELPVPWGELPSFDEFYDLEEDLRMRGVAWGRVPAERWKSVYMNLDIVNQAAWEVVEYEGDEMPMVLDPEWDPKPFLRKLREMLRKLEESGRLKPAAE